MTKTLRLPSASSLARAKACPASCVLPRVDSVSEYAALGTAVHAFLARAREIGFSEALAEVALDEPHYHFCASIPWESIPQGGRAEVAFAVEVRSFAARELGVLSKARAYEIEPGEIPGTADLVGILGDAVYVADWKTGYRYLGPAAESLQLRFLAAAAATVYQKDRAIVEFWRLREDGTFFRDRAEFDAFELMAIQGEVRDIVEAVVEVFESDEPLSVTVGEHCEFCPSIPHCPGQAALARSIAQVSAPGPLTIEDASKAWEVLDRYDEIAKRARMSLREFAKLHPFPVGVGKELRLVDRSYSTVDLTIAKALLEERFGAEAASDAVEKKITQAGIEEVLRKKASKEGLRLSDLKRELLAELEKRRGLIRGMRPEVRISKAKVG